MARGKKPGTPGRTTIAPPIVSSVTERLSAAFRRHGYDQHHELFVIPQQGYLYLEAEPMPGEVRTPGSLSSSSMRVRIPLGRMRFLGSEETWEYQPYRYSDEEWDLRNAEVGTPEELLLSMVLDQLH